MSRALHVLNINSGAICVRTSASDEHPMIMRPIDLDTVIAIRSGEVDVNDVIEAITKSDMTADGFKYKEYFESRKAADEKFNVSRREMIPVNGGEKAPEEEKPDTTIFNFKKLGITKKGKRGAEKEREEKKSEKKPEGGSELDGIIGK